MWLLVLLATRGQAADNYYDDAPKDGDHLEGRQLHQTVTASGYTCNDVAYGQCYIPDSYTNLGSSTSTWLAKRIYTTPYSNTPSGCNDNQEEINCMHACIQRANNEGISSVCCNLQRDDFSYDVELPTSKIEFPTPWSYLE